MEALILHLSKQKEARRGASDTPLHRTAYMGWTERLAELLAGLPQGSPALDQRNHLGCTPLRLAAGRGHCGCARLLIAKGCRLDVADIKAQTALSVAVKQRHVGVVHMLLKAGACPDGHTHCLASPLYLAAMDGHQDCLQLLIVHGADITHPQGGQGRGTHTPLHVSLAYSRIGCFSMLLQAGALDYELGRPYAALALLSLVLRQKNRPAALLLHRHGAGLEVDAAGAGIRLTWPGHSTDQGTDRSVLIKAADQQDLEFVTTFRESVGLPQSLGSLTRIAIRRSLGWKRMQYLPLLPLPPPLIKYLAMPNEE